MAEAGSFLSASESFLAGKERHRTDIFQMQDQNPNFLARPKVATTTIRSEMHQMDGVAVKTFRAGRSPGRVVEVCRLIEAAEYKLSYALQKAPQIWPRQLLSLVTR